jgi:hypothetical protein
MFFPGKLNGREQLRERGDLNLRQSMLVADACDALVTGLAGFDSLDSLNQKTKDKLMSHTGMKRLDSDEV